MNGLLWYDPTANLPKIISDAAARYYKKFGIKPDTCFVNRAQFARFQEDQHGDIAVKPSDTVMPNYVWLGVSNPTPPRAKIFSCHYCGQEISSENFTSDGEFEIVCQEHKRSLACALGQARKELRDPMSDDELPF